MVSSSCRLAVAALAVVTDAVQLKSSDEATEMPFAWEAAAESFIQEQWGFGFLTWGKKEKGGKACPNMKKLMDRMAVQSKDVIEGFQWIDEWMKDPKDAKVKAWSHTAAQMAKQDDKTVHEIQTHVNALDGLTESGDCSKKATEIDNHLNGLHSNLIQGERELKKMGKFFKEKLMSSRYHGNDLLSSFTRWSKENTNHIFEIYGIIKFAKDLLQRMADDLDKLKEHREKELEKEYGRW